MIQELMATIKQLIRRVSVLESQIELPDMGSFLAIDGSNANQPINIQGQNLVNVGQLAVGTDTPNTPLYIVGETAGVNNTGSFVNKSIDASAQVKFSLLLSQVSGAIKDAGGVRVIKDSTWGSNASTDAKMVFDVVENNVSMEIMSLDGGGAVIFNEVGHANPASIIQAIRASVSPTVNVTEWQNSGGSAMSAIAKNGAFKPASLADSAAENNTIYYSTTASKLVYKDGAGIVNNLY